MAQLPHELIDSILEDVSDSSLAACSLTARAFVPVSQRRLFRRMTLSNIAAYERTARLLSSSPHLWQHFRFLAIDINQVPRNYPLLKAILEPLTEIEYLSITGRNTQLGENPCLIDFLSLPSIKCFALAGIRGVPSSLISLVFNSSFKEVFFSSLLILGKEEAEEWSPSTDLWKVTISADRYRSMLPFMLHPKRMPSLCRIKHLSVAIPAIVEALVNKFKDLLVLCSSTLEYLSLELERSLALPALPALRTLELMLDTELAKSPARLHTIIAETITSLPHLESLTLAFLDRFRGLHPPPHLTPRHQWTGHRPWMWADIDSLLVDTPHLRSVQVSLRYLEHEPERYAAFVPFMQSQLPRAFDAGFITFSYRPFLVHGMDTFTLEG
ncbi:hypothetical protein B0H11DRAFT_2019345 [Mycena galericulata]|nr:hypothetical protein B0H11DRAFT_2019345 [Mycena galericulata]